MAEGVDSTRSDWAEEVHRAATAISEADALLIGAGAGMGVDSGLPDFRGDEGFWKAYPPFKEQNLSFMDLANPRWFLHDPARAWGFYGHRLMLYRQTKPHLGFSLLKKWSEKPKHGAFVFTSNVDGHFQNSGFDPKHVLECHGAIGHFQCNLNCSNQIWNGVDTSVAVDEQFRAIDPLPKCPQCGNIARPNILMFGDQTWNSGRADEQIYRYQQWLEKVKHKKVVAIEMGAGIAIPTVRMECQRLGDTLIRINPREWRAPQGSVSFATGALEALRAIDAVLTKWQGSA